MIEWSISTSHMKNSAASCCNCRWVGGATRLGFNEEAACLNAIGSNTGFPPEGLTLQPCMSSDRVLSSRDSAMLQSQSLQEASFSSSERSPGVLARHWTTALMKQRFCPSFLNPKGAIPADPNPNLDMILDRKELSGLVASEYGMDLSDRSGLRDKLSPYQEGFADGESSLAVAKCWPPAKLDLAWREGIKLNSVFLTGGGASEVPFFSSFFSPWNLFIILLNLCCVVLAHPDMYMPLSDWLLVFGLFTGVALKIFCLGICCWGYWLKAIPWWNAGFPCCCCCFRCMSSWTCNLDMLSWCCWCSSHLKNGMNSLARQTYKSFVCGDGMAMLCSSKFNHD